MDLFEYQAKELFAKHNVPTTPGRVTDSAEDAKAIAEEIGKPVMVKAQVKVGGRGKAGGVKYAATPDDAFTHAQNILGLDIKGHIVKKLLVAEASDIAEEYYISFLLDRSNRTYLAMCSVEGGMEIEEVAATKPERLAKVPVDAVKGVDLAFARSIAEQGHLPAEVLDAAAVTIQKLWEVFVKRGRHPGRGQPAGAHAGRCRRHCADCLGDRLLAGVAATAGHVDLQRSHHPIFGLPRFRRWIERRPSVAGSRPSS